MDPLVLTLNAGSSSLKYALFPARNDDAARDRIAAGAVMRIGVDGGDAVDHAQALEKVLQALTVHGCLAQLVAVGHRVVHGGPHYDRATIVTGDVLSALRDLRPLDPDHMPVAIALIEAMQKRMPELPQVACFDTAFHRTMPRVARTLPIPRAFEAEGITRYGFHGLSYGYLMNELERLAGAKAARGRIVLAHLGSGSSLAAVSNGKCIDTTMGFTPTSGIPMGTRSGDLDPGVLLYLLRSKKLSVDAVDDLVNRKCGLLGVSETTSDMRDLLAREPSDPRAREAVDVFSYAAKKAIGALAAALGGIDTLIFSGGIGAKAAPARARIAQGLEHLGIAIDAEKNEASAAILSSHESPCTVRVIETDEESVIARETAALLG
ncbi:MAG: acetate/propionate family kinase [Polyangiaceae bacterium]